MASREWRTLVGNPARLRAARLQAHYALQWLARAARAFITATPDDSHTNLGWDEALKSFTTHPLRGGVRLGLRLADLTLLVIDASQTRSLPLDGRADSDARNWLGEQMAAFRLDPGALDAPSPYEMPADPIAGGGRYGGQGNALTEISAWFGNANISLASVQRQMTDRKLAASPVRCWPHHFDLATLTTLDKSGTEHGHSVNAGFSPGDHYYEEPYFYVSPYPYPDAATLPKLPSLGHWHTHEFTAAVAPASRIVAAGNPQRDLDAFLRGATEACLAALA